MIKGKKILAFLCLLMFLLVATSAQAVPEFISYQGYLTDTDGNPVNTSVSMTFRIYDTDNNGTPIPGPGNLLWSENQPTVNILDGVYTVQLGKVSALTALAFDIPYWLTVEVETDGEMTPRQALDSNPYAVTAGSAESVDWANVSNIPAGFADNTDDLATSVDGMSGGEITGKVGIGNPIKTDVQLVVYGNGADGVAGYFEANSGKNGSYGLFGKSTGGTGQWHTGLYGQAAGALFSNIGVQGNGSGGERATGVYASGDGGTEFNRGVYAYAVDTSAQNNYGVWAVASGGTSANYGVYAEGSGNNAYAGYFAGRLHTTNNLTVDGTISGNGSGLTNVSADWADLTNVPAEVETLVANGVIDLAAGSSIGGTDFVTAGTVAGGDVTGTFDNLQLAADSVTASDIEAGAVGTSEITDGSINFSDIDQNSCATDQVMKWNGTVWACAADIDTTVTSVDGLAGGEISGNVGIGSPVNSSSQLTVSGSGVETTGGYFAANYTGSGASIGLYGENSNSGAGTEHYGVKGTATNASFRNVGLSGIAIGGQYATGLQATAGGGSHNRAVDGQSSSSSPTNYGVYGSATNGTSANYGVFGNAAGTNAYAGYFAGNLHTTSNLTVFGTISGNGSGLTNVNWASLANVPAGFADNVDDQVTSVDGLAGGTINGAVGVNTSPGGTNQFSVLSSDAIRTAAGSFTTDNSSASVSYGVKAYNWGTGTGTHYGVFGYAGGSSTKNIGIYGNAVGTNAHAGYFNGHTMIVGGQWDPSASEGDLKIGTDSQRLKIGVATSGGGAGIARIFADGDNPKIILGSGATRDVLAVSDGNVGIGTIEPGYKLHVLGSTYSTTGWSTSDERWKTNIHTLDDALHKVSHLRGVSYDWRTDEFPDMGFTEEPQIGVIAQEVERVVPELVHTDQKGYKAVAYDKLTALLIEAVKELKSQNEALQALVCQDHPQAEACR